MRTRKGFFCVVEGGEASGKSTQKERVVSVISALGGNVLSTKEPYDEPENEVGYMIRQILLGNLENPGYTELQKLFVLARRWHLTNIVIPAVNMGKIVICDRYIASTFAYHKSKGGSFEEVRKWHMDCYYPADITLWVRVPVTVALERLSKRGGKKELFDKVESIRAIDLAYNELLGQGDLYIPNFKKIDGNQDPEKVTRDIVNVLSQFVTIH